MKQRKHIAEQFELPNLKEAPLRTFGSLFAGVGGFDLAGEQCGLECVWQVEIDENCRKLLAAKFPKAKQFVDVREDNPLERVDIITMGFPCQSLSIAGKREGFSGVSSLFYDGAKIIGRLKPKVVILENVPGILSLKYEHDYEPGTCVCGIHTDEETCPRCFRRLGTERRHIVGTVLGDVLRVMAHIGYTGATRVFDAQYFKLAQRRRRWFGVFALGDFGAECGSKVLSITEGVRRHPAPSRKTREGTAAATGAGVAGSGGRPGPSVTGAQCSRNRGGGGLGTDTELDGGVIPDTALSLRAKAQSAHAADLQTYVPGVAPSWTARDSKGERQDISEPSLIAVTHSLTGEGFDASEDGTGRGTPIVPAEVAPTVTSNGDAHSGMRDEKGLVAIGVAGEDVGFALRANPSHSGDKGDGGINTTFAIQEIGKRQSGNPQNGVGYSVDDPMFTLQATAQHGLANRAGVRRLTPRECERLMGFSWLLPDGHWSPDWSSDFSDSTRYRMMGNSVAIPCVVWIIRRLLHFYPQCMTSRIR